MKGPLYKKQAQRLSLLRPKSFRNSDGLVNSNAIMMLIACSCGRSTLDIDQETIDLAMMCQSFF